jgi:microcystin-dependent protein
MSDQFTGEIQLFGFNFAPYQWAQATGQTVGISQNSTLFSLLGTFYGGNGTTTFQLPNFVNRIACAQGTGPGRSSRVIGETFGENGVTLSSQEIPAHNHSVTAYTVRGGANKVAQPSTGYLLGTPTTPLSMTTAAANTILAPTTIGVAGGNGPHENRQPVLAINYSIALYGIYPSFN